MMTASQLYAALRGLPHLVTAELEHYDAERDECEILFVECTYGESVGLFGESAIGVQVAEPYGITALGQVIPLTPEQCAAAVAQVEQNLGRISRC